MSSVHKEVSGSLFDFSRHKSALFNRTPPNKDAVNSKSLPANAKELLNGRQLGNYKWPASNKGTLRTSKKVPSKLSYLRYRFLCAHEIDIYILPLLILEEKNTPASSIVWRPLLCIKYSACFIFFRKN